MKYILLIFLFAYSISSFAEIKIGVLANRGSHAVKADWDATKDYLEQELQEKVKIVPMKFVDIHSSIKNRAIDFIFMNPILYVENEYRFGIEKVLRVQRYYKGKYLEDFGSVVFKKSSSSKYSTDWSDLRIAGVSKKSLGGWLIAKKELLDKKIKLNIEDVLYLKDHYKVVLSVLNGTNDIGIVRTGALEELIGFGQIDKNDFEVMFSKNDSTYDYLSTSLYPGWNLSILKGVSEDIRIRVVSALLGIQYQNIEIAKELGHKWSLPSSYSRVHKLLRKLSLYPYDFWTQVSFAKIIQQNPKRFIFMMSLLTLLSILIFLMVRNKRYIRTLFDELEKERDQLDHFVEMVPSLLLFLDENHNIIKTSKKFNDLIGIDNLVGKRLRHFFHGIQCEQFFGNIEQVGEYKIDDNLFIMKNDGTLPPVSISAFSQEFMGEKRVVVIVEEQQLKQRVALLEKERELKRIENAKIRSVGILGSGVAHEINNPLTIINSSAKILLRFLQKEKFDNAKWKKMLEDTISAGNRISDIIEALRLLGKDEEDAPCAKYPLSKFINSSLILVSTRFVKKGFSIHFNYEHVTSVAYLSHVKFHQILVNIFLNAEKYLDELKGVKKSLSISIEILDEFFFLLKISNTGQRISKKMEKDIFIPFASDSTEVTGRGTSMAQSKIYLEKYSGDIWIDPQAENTTFIIKFPFDYRQIS